jgi:hypothetical protein
MGGHGEFPLKISERRINGLSNDKGHPKLDFFSKPLLLFLLRIPNGI